MLDKLVGIETRYEEINQLEKKDEDRVILHVGSKDWPFPVPIVRVGNAWSFSTSEGREEMLNRRIGQNELNVIQVCLAVVDAQRDYAAEDRTLLGIAQGVRGKVHPTLRQLSEVSLVCTGG